MTVRTPTGTGAHAGTGVPATGYDYEAEHGGGWVTFAGVMLMIAGVMNVISGIAAIDDAQFYINNAKFIISDLNLWGWVITILGAVQVLVAFGVWARNGLSRWLGVAFASANAIAQLLLLPAFPLFSLAIFTLDLLIIYGLVSYGGRLEARA
jgi:hypothetical protein